MSSEVVVEKIPGGFRVDGLDLKGGKCGCTSVLPCCHSWSKLKRNGNEFLFSLKTSGPVTINVFHWSYKVAKGGVTVTVTAEDARDKKIFSGYYPPALEDWEDAGWQVLEKNGSREDFGLWRCAACRWLYKEQVEGTKFENLADDWKCPVCKAPKSAFEQIG